MAHPVGTFVVGAGGPLGLLLDAVLGSATGGIHPQNVFEAMLAEHQQNGVKLNPNQLKNQHIDMEETKSIISKRQKRKPLVDEQDLDFLNETEKESLFYQNNRKA